MSCNATDDGSKRQRRIVVVARPETSYIQVLATTKMVWMEKGREKKDLQARKPEAAKDPPYLASLLKYHPGLTREEALEMIKAFGG